MKRVMWPAVVLAMVAGAWAVTPAQTTRVSIGTVNCTTDPGIYRNGDNDTGFCIAAPTSTTGPGMVVNGVQRFAATTTGTTETGNKTITGNLTVTGSVTAASAAVTGAVTVADEAYASAWNGALSVPTKNAIWDANFPRSLTAASTAVYTAVSALDGSNPTPVTPGLTTIVGCSLTLYGASAPGLGTSVLTFTNAGTNLVNVYGWKPTGAGDTTLIASTGTDQFSVTCWGTP